MKILVLAPHPFYQDRGTPIAVDLLVRTLSEQGHSVDCLCFNEGVDRHYPRFRLFRARSIPEIRGIRPGFSAKKLYVDFFFFLRFIGLFVRNRYDVVHAVEESAFMALILCKLFRQRFVYDMDSLMTTQLVDKSPVARRFEGLLRWLESLPMRGARAVVPVCEALAEEVRKYRHQGIFLLKDVSLVGSSTDPASMQPAATDDLRAHFGIEGPLLLYIGNLERYQGIDLMLESFALLHRELPAARLVIIGGEDRHIEAYREKASALCVTDGVHFAGRKPVGLIDHYMKQADLLLSPRVHGENTPMKVYSYLDSGTPVVATRLPTHTQVMADSNAFLAGDNPDAFARAMSRALSSPELRQEKAAAAKALIAREHSLQAFSQRLAEIYEYLARDQR